MTKSETHVGFKLLGNYWNIKQNICSNKKKVQKEKEIASPFLAYLDGFTD